MAGVAATSAGASASLSVPCSSGATGLVAALNAADASGGGTINLASGCVHTITIFDNGENGLPVVTSKVAVNGNGATSSALGAPLLPFHDTLEDPGRPGRMKDELPNPDGDHPSIDGYRRLGELAFRFPFDLP